MCERLGACQTNNVVGVDFIVANQEKVMDNNQLVIMQTFDSIDTIYLILQIGCSS